MNLLFKLFLATVLLLISFLPVQIAEAHSSLIKNSPLGGERLIERPKTIELWFKDPVIVHSGSIQVIDSSGEMIQMENISPDADDPTHIIGRLKEELPVGHYMVGLSVIALDGDVVNEKFSFEVIDHQQDQAVKPLLLVKQTPADGEIIDENVTQIDLWFNQPAKLTAIGVFNERSYMLKEPVQDPSDPNHIIVELAEPLEKGTYQVTWYGHPTSEELVAPTDSLDVFYFAVEEFAPLKENPMGTPIKTTPFLSNIGMKQVGYWFFFIGIILLFGASFFKRIILGEGNHTKRWTKVSWSLFILSLLGVVLIVFEQRIILQQLTLQEFLSIKLIYLPLIQMMILVSGLLIKRIQLVAFFVAILLVPFAMGHALYPRYGGYFTVAINALHILFAGIWLGGLFSLLIYSNHRDFSSWLEKVGGRFSKWSAISLGMIIVTGLVMTYKYIPAFTIESFYESNWGKAILFKIALMIMMVFIGYRQRKTIKKLSSALLAKFKFRGYNEMLYGLFILFFASILVVTTPSAAEQGVYPIYQGDQDQLEIQVSPFKPGLNVMNLDFNTQQEVESVEVNISMPPQYKVTYDAFKVGANQFAITGNIFHAAGSLYMEVRAEYESGEVEIVEYSIVVPGESRLNE
jgi:copper transport protein